MAASLDDLTQKVDSGDRLSDDEVALLGSSRDIIALGMLASAVRRRLRGNTVTYLRVVDLSMDKGADLKVGPTGPTPVGPAVGPTGPTPVGPAGGTAVGPTPVGPTFRSADSAGEVRIFGTPQTLDRAVAIVETARDVAGAVPLSAFCLFELGKLPEGLPVVLAAVKQAGLDTIAQAPIDRLGEPERALESAADAGLAVARVTVDQTPARDWTAVCREVAALQTRLRTIRAFAPLARSIDATQPTTGYDDVRRIAVARLLADNIDTVQVDWTLYGPKLAQVALTFGADDIDSVPAVDDESQGRRRSSVEDVRRSIRAAGFEPLERDGRWAIR